MSLLSDELQNARKRKLEESLKKQQEREALLRLDNAAFAPLLEMVDELCASGIVLHDGPLTPPTPEVLAWFRENKQIQLQLSDKHRLTMSLVYITQPRPSSFPNAASNRYSYGYGYQGAIVKLCPANGPIVVRELTTTKTVERAAAWLAEVVAAFEILDPDNLPDEIRPPAQLDGRERRIQLDATGGI